MNLSFISSLVAPIFGVIDKAVTDKDLAQQLKHEIQSDLINNSAKELESAANIIIAEAQGGSWLQQSWRPITMLTFTALVVAHWLGFTAENLPEEQVLSLLEIVKVGLAGYVLGRSGEKIMKEYKKS